MLKALAQQERQATRSRQRDAHAGPRDDLDIEMEALLAKQQQSYPGCEACQHSNTESQACIHIHSQTMPLENHPACSGSRVCSSTAPPALDLTAALCFAGCWWKVCRARLHQRGRHSRLQVCACSRPSRRSWAMSLGQMCL